MHYLSIGIGDLTPAQVLLVEKTSAIIAKQRGQKFVIVCSPPKSTPFDRYDARVPSDARIPSDARVPFPKRDDEDIEIEGTALRFRRHAASQLRLLAQAENKPVDGYVYDAAGGQKSTVFVIDSGFLTDHVVSVPVGSFLSQSGQRAQHLYTT